MTLWNTVMICPLLFDSISNFLIVTVCAIFEKNNEVMLYRLQLVKFFCKEQLVKINKCLRRRPIERRKNYKCSFIFLLNLVFVISNCLKFRMWSTDWIISLKNQSIQVFLKVRLRWFLLVVLSEHHSSVFLYGMTGDKKKLILGILDAQWQGVAATVGL